MKQFSAVELIYHDKDADGFLSMELMQYLFDCISSIQNNNIIKLYKYGYNYEHQAIEPDVIGTDNAKLYWLQQPVETHKIFVDCTPPVWWLEKHKNKQELIHIIDHHKNACENIISKSLVDKNNIFYVDGTSASMLVSNLMSNIKDNKFFDFIFDMKFKPNMLTKVLSNFVDNKKYLDDIQKEIDSKLQDRVFKSIVQNINDYDIWDWIEDYNMSGNLNPMILYRGLTSIYLDNNYEILNSYFDGLLNSLNLELSIRKQGEIEVAKEQSVLEKTTYWAYFEGEKSIAVVNSSVNFFITDTLLTYCDAVLYWDKIEDKPNMFKFGMRSEKTHFDCATYLKKITNGNGGGHFNAAGGSMEFLNFTTFMSEKLNDQETTNNLYIKDLL